GNAGHEPVATGNADPLEADAFGLHLVTQPLQRPPPATGLPVGHPAERLRHAIGSLRLGPATDADLDQGALTLRQLPDRVVADPVGAAPAAFLDDPEGRLDRDDGRVGPRRAQRRLHAVSRAGADSL